MCLLKLMCFDFGKERNLHDFKTILFKSGWMYVKRVNCRSAIDVIEDFILAFPDYIKIHLYAIAF